VSIACVSGGTFVCFRQATEEADFSSRRQAAVVDDRFKAELERVSVLLSKTHLSPAS